MQKETTYEVYRLTNSVNNKIYVGATMDGAGVRWNRHPIIHFIKQFENLERIQLD